MCVCAHHLIKNCAKVQTVLLQVRLNEHLLLCCLTGDLVPYLHAEETRYEDAHNLENTKKEEPVHGSAVFAGIFLHRKEAGAMRSNS